MNLKEKGDLGRLYTLIRVAQCGETEEARSLKEGAAENSDKFGVACQKGLFVMSALEKSRFELRIFEIKKSQNSRQCRYSCYIICLRGADSQNEKMTIPH